MYLSYKSQISKCAHRFSVRNIGFILYYFRQISYTIRLMKYLKYLKTLKISFEEKKKKQQNIEKLYVYKL